MWPTGEGVRLFGPLAGAGGWLPFDCNWVCAGTRAGHRGAFESSGTKGGSNVFSVRTMQPDFDIFAGADPRDLALHVVRFNDLFDSLNVVCGGHFVFFVVGWFLYLEHTPPFQTVQHLFEFIFIVPCLVRAVAAPSTRGEGANRRLSAVQSEGHTEPQAGQRIPAPPK